MKRNCFSDDHNELRVLGDAVSEIVTMAIEAFVNNNLELAYKLNH